MTDELPVLDPELAEMFALERQRPEPGDAARARASTRLLQALAPVAFAAAPPSLVRRAWRTVRGAHPALTAAVSFAVGVGVGATVQGSLSARVPAPTVSARPVPALAPSASAPEPELLAPVWPPTPTEASSAAPAAASVPTKAPSASAGAEQAQAERLLLDVAYAALGQGQPAQALEPLEQHARRFPQGALREEREALTIQCLHDLGNLEEARRRALSFKVRYPNSLFAPRIERVLAAPAASVTNPLGKKP
ncbi:MAG TPA: hypothetical protein VJN18_23850 [Polyangiaceae bacterium]|nr:hypothetical protein [Polyangiaceae bacterium]